MKDKTLPTAHRHMDKHNTVIGKQDKTRKSFKKTSRGQTNRQQKFNFTRKYLKLL